MIIEVDILFAHVKKKDSLKEAAERTLRKILLGELKVEASSEVVNEIVVWHKSHEYTEEHVRAVLTLISAIPINYLPLTPEIAISASILAEKYKLTHFDSYHVATALSRPDKTIISSDEAFDQVPELNRVHPKNI